MSKIKGPAISEDTFKVSGHCCGVRFDHIDADQGFPFELTPEARKQLEAQGMSLPPQNAAAEGGAVGAASAAKSFDP